MESKRAVINRFISFLAAVTLLVAATAATPPVAGASPGQGWISVSTGQTTTCAISAENHLYCWGLGGVIEPGSYNSYSFTNTPTRIGNLKWKAVSVKASGLCAIDYDGALWCGAGEGALWPPAGGETWNRGKYPPPPCCGATPAWLLQWGRDYDWVAVDSSDREETCAIKSSGALFCWGSETARVTSNYGGSWKEVAVDGDNACAIKSEGSLWCWGVNSWGQTGSSILTGNPYIGCCSFVPAVHWTPTQVGTDTDWAHVATGLSTCAEKTNGALWCWGWNRSGEIGSQSDLPKVGQYEIPTALFPVPRSISETWLGAGAQVANDWTPINWATPGAEQSCAIDEENALFCWGYNEHGRVGNGTNFYAALPVQIRFGTTISWPNVNFVESNSTVRYEDFHPTRSGGLEDPVVESLTPAVCTWVNGLSTHTHGTCKLRATGASTVSANYVVSDFEFRVRDRQIITILAPQTVTPSVLPGLSMDAFAVATSSSGLPFTYLTLHTPAICAWMPNAETVRPISPGQCHISYGQDGNDQFGPERGDIYVSILRRPRVTFDLPQTARAGDPDMILSGSSDIGQLPKFELLPGSTGCSLSVATLSFVSAGTCQVRGYVDNVGWWGDGYVDWASGTITKEIAVYPPGISQAITFTEITSKNTAQGPLALQASASSGLPIVFESSNTTVCTVTGALVQLLQAGVCSITAMQAGDMTYLPAPSVTRTFTVSVALLRNRTVQVRTEAGVPVSGALMTWSLGSLRSSSPRTTDANGRITWTGLPAGNVSFVVTPQSSTRAGNYALNTSWSGVAQITSSTPSIIRLPNPLTPDLNTLLVRTPQGIGIEGAFVSVDGLSCSEGLWSAVFCSGTSTSSDATGHVQIVGYCELGPDECPVSITVVDGDVALDVERTLGECAIDETTCVDAIGRWLVTIDSLPYVEASQTEYSAPYAQVLSLTVVARDSGGAPIPGQRLDLTPGTTGLSATNCPSVLTGLSDLSGIVTFKICPVLTGFWKADGPGLVPSARINVAVSLSPAAPLSPVALSSAARTARVTWTKPSNEGASNVIDYVVQYRREGTLAWSTFNDGRSTATTATVTRLISNVRYEFRVAAVNRSGAGDYSVIARVLVK